MRVSGRSIAGIAFSSAMHSLIALGSDGARLTPSVTWADGRAAEQARRLRASGETELRATGGFARSRFWRQLLADVLGSPIGFPVGGQGSVIGAALLGHVALGHLRSVDAAASLVRVTRVVHPGPDDARFYRALLPAFARTGEAVQDLHPWSRDGWPDDPAGTRAGRPGERDPG